MKKMIKSFLMLLCLVSVFVLIPAQSKASFILLEDWTFDMNANYGDDYGVWDNIFQLNFDSGILPNTYIKQDLGDSGKFEIGGGGSDYWIDDGMTFQESVYLELSSSSTTEGGLSNEKSDLIASGNQIILGAENLTGSITNVRQEDGEIKWDYTFDPGGTIGFYLMENTTYQNYADNFDYTGYTGGLPNPYAQTLMKLEVVSPSSGSTPGFQGGTFEGQSSFGVTMKVTDAQTNMFLSSSGEDLWLTYGLEELLFAGQTGDVGLGTAAFSSDDGGKFFTVTGNTGDKFQLQAVPEPTTLLLFGTGLLGLAAFGRKKLMRS